MQSGHLSDSTGGVHEVELGDNIHLPVRVRPKAHHWKGTERLSWLQIQTVAAKQNRNCRGQEGQGVQGGEWWVVDRLPSGVERQNKSSLRGPRDIEVSLSLSLLPPIHYGLRTPYPKPSELSRFQIQNVSYVGKVLCPKRYILCNTLSKIWSSTP